MFSNQFQNFLSSPIPPILVGRDELIEGILREIGNSQPRAYELAAASYMGSSALLRYLAAPDRLFKQKKELISKTLKRENYCPIYLDAAEMLEDVSVGDWLLEGALECRQLQKFVKDSGFKFSNQSIRDSRNLLKKSRSAGLNTVFLIDHFDQKFTKLRPEESMNLRGLTSFASFVIATRKPLAKLNHYAYGSWFGSVTKRIKLGPVTEKAKRELLSWCLIQSEALTKAQAKELIPVYSKATAIAGMIPSFILSAGEELCSLRVSLPQIPGDVVEKVLRDRLNTVFQPNFSYYYRHLDREYKTSISNLLGDSLNDQDYARLIDLQSLGLLTVTSGINPRFQPFSSLFEHYLKIEASTGQNKVVVSGEFSALHSRILELLLEKPGQAASYELMLKRIWNKPVDDKNLRLVRETMRGLKGKMIGRIDGEIITHRGVGYELRLNPESG